MPGAELRSLLPGLLALRLAAPTVGDLTEEGGDIGGDAVGLRLACRCEEGIEDLMGEMNLDAAPASRSANIAADAPDGRPSKRKAPAAIRAHWGLPSDSSDRLSLIALSRLVRSPDLLTVNKVFENPPGVVVLRCWLHSEVWSCALR